MNAAERAALEPLIRADLARRRLLDFAERMYPRFEAPPHLRYIANLLEECEAGKRRRIAISVPVRHGKSVLCSQIFPAWVIGRDPRANVILASHSEDLAVRNSRIAKHLVEDDRWPFDVKLAGDSASAGRWNTKEGGGGYAIGVGGAITGRGADFLIIDDALHDGLSQTERDSAFRWYQEVAIPRLEPGGSVICIGARFAEDDLIGQIFASEDGPNWEVVNFTAIAEENDALGREPGEPLWPARMDLGELQMRRVAMGTRAFESQFQQRPVSTTGGTFQRQWFTNTYREVPEYSPEPIAPELSTYGIVAARPRKRPTLKIMAVDCASKIGVANDFSVISVLVGDGLDIYIADLVRAKVEFTDLCRLVAETYRKHWPQGIYIEDASSGIPLVQQMRAQTSFPVIAVPPKGSKVSRAEMQSPLFEAGRIKVPERAHWLAPMIDEFAGFPGGRHDDQVDSVCLGIAVLRAFEARRLRSAGGPNLKTLSQWGFSLP